jgi:hypothetical protein
VRGSPPDLGFPPPQSLFVHNSTLPVARYYQEEPSAISCRRFGRAPSPRPTLLEPLADANEPCRKPRAVNSMRWGPQQKSGFHPNEIRKGPPGVGNLDLRI